MQQETRTHGIYQTLLFPNQKSLRDTAMLYFGRTVTYRGMFAQVERCARAFLRWGVRAGDAVLVCAAGTPELVYSLMALWKLGAVPHLLNHSCTPAQTAACIRQSKAGLFLVTDQFLPQMQHVGEQGQTLQTVVIPVAQSMPFLARRAATEAFPVSSMDLVCHRYILWKDFIESGHSILSAPAVLLSEAHTALVIYPSAPGGEGVPLSHGALCENMAQYERKARPRARRERVLALTSPWESWGVSAGILAPLCLGLTLVLEPRQQLRTCLQALLRERPAHLVAPAGFWRKAPGRLELQGVELSFLHTVMYATGADEDLTKEEEAAIDAFLLAHGCKAGLRRI